MAIIKKLGSSFGIEASYHKVTNINIDYPNRVIVICVCTYISKDTRVNGCDPIDSIDIEIPKEDFDLFQTGNVLETAYNWLKVNVEGFDDAKDDLDICSKLIQEDKKNDSA